LHKENRLVFWILFCLLFHLTIKGSSALVGRSGIVLQFLELISGSVVCNSARLSMLLNDKSAKELQVLEINEYLKIPMIVSKMFVLLAFM